MATAAYLTGQGSQAVSEVLAAFTDNGKDYIVVRCARGTYDVAEPFTVLLLSECVITYE